MTNDQIKNIANKVSQFQVVPGLKIALTNNKYS